MRGRVRTRDGGMWWPEEVSLRGMLSPTAELPKRWCVADEPNLRVAEAEVIEDS